MNSGKSTPWWKYCPWTLGLAAVAVIVNLELFLREPAASGPWIDGLQFDRQAILQGQLWRLLTGNLVHWGSEHFLLNVGAFVAVGLMYERPLGRYYPWILLGSGAAVGMGVLVLRPDMAVYRGLSGVDSGQFAAALAVEFAAALRKPHRWYWVGPVAGLFVVKIFYECTFGQPLFGTESLGEIGLPTPIAHAAGTLAALILLGWVLLSPEERLRCGGLTLHRGKYHESA